MIWLKQMTKASIQTGLAYRAFAITTSVTNLLYIVIVYFLWKAIYQGQSQLNGLSFEQSFLYMTVAGSLYSCYVTFVDWSISRSIRSGQIAVDLLRPISYRALQFSANLGFLLSNILFITLPALVLIISLSGGGYEAQVYLLLFPLMLVLSYLIAFQIDFIIGTFSFYTESIWGIITAKETIILTFSGVLVPFAFFPEQFQVWLQWTPFVAIFHAPTTVILGQVESGSALAKLLANQVVWLLSLWYLSGLFFTRASRMMTVNGG